MKLDAAPADEPLPPALVIHDATHARQAVAAARQAGCATMLLLSSPNAGCFMGPAWWRALIGLAGSLDPAVAVHDVLDCGDAAGRAMEALRLGQSDLVLGHACPQRDAVLARAGPLGATIRAIRPAALDLAEPGAARRLADWLAAGGLP